MEVHECAQKDVMQLYGGMIFAVFDAEEKI